MAESKKKSKHSKADSDDDDLLTDRPSDPVLIGVTHWGSLKRKKLLCGISVSHILLVTARFPCDSTAFLLLFLTKPTHLGVDRESDIATVSRSAVCIR